MAKTKKARTKNKANATPPKKRNPTDATLRNTRASASKVTRLEDEIDMLKGRLQQLEDVVAARLPAPG